MTPALKATLTRLVDARDSYTLSRMHAVLTDRHDRQQVRLAISIIGRNAGLRAATPLTVGELDFLDRNELAAGDGDGFITADLDCADLF